jgi:hypothetical protein
MSSSKKSMTVKTYVVLQRDNIRGTESVIAVKLTADAAQKIVDKTPGTRVQKFIADKLPHA